MFGKYKKLYLKEVALNTEAKRYYLLRVKLSRELFDIDAQIKTAGNWDNQQSSEQIEALFQKGMRLKRIYSLIENKGLTEEEATLLVDNYKLTTLSDKE